MAANFYFIIAGLLSVYIAKTIASYISAARFKKAHGCKPEHKLPQPERFLGYGLYKTQTNASKNKELLEGNYKRFQANGTTWSSRMMGATYYNTIDPENVKAILATNFKSFGLGGRLEALGALLGKGIFTTDGAEWEHSRVSF